MKTVEAATCVVAVATKGCHDGSIKATAAGTATALPDVVATPQAAYPGLPPALSQRSMNAPQIKQVIAPRTIPVIPPLKMFVILIPEPRQNPTKGIKMLPAGSRNLCISLSKLPKIIPTKRGPIAATKAINGMFASPDAPSAQRVRNGPSFMVNNDMEAQSVSSPNSLIRAR